MHIKQIDNELKIKAKEFFLSKALYLLVFIDISFLESSESAP